VIVSRAFPLVNQDGTCGGLRYLLAILSVLDAAVSQTKAVAVQSQSH
jgi:hypothetical protein